MEELVLDTFQRTGRLDYIFNNAGIAIGGGVIDYSIEDWTYIINVNLLGVINGIQAAYKLMVNQGFGHIVNTASMAGLMPSPGAVSYSTTKHAVVGLSKSLRTPILHGGTFGRILGKVSPEGMKVISLMWEKLKPMPPDKFAEKVLNAVAENKAIIIEPSWWKWIWMINRFFPGLGIKLAQMTFQKTESSFKSLSQ